MTLRSFPYLAALAGIFYLSFARAEEPAQDAASKQAVDEQRVPLELARDRAKLMGHIYSSTLDVMHERYFHGERAMVPARAMEDVFETLAAETKINARWISVNARPMSLTHEPKSDFEKKAADALAAGKSEVELVEDGYYRRATPIALGSGCVACHAGFFSAPPKTPRFAGLVISVPIKLEASAAR